MLSTEERERAVQRYLATLRRLPDEAVLYVVGSDFDEEKPQQCIVGWAVRYDVARLNGIDPKEVDAYALPGFMSEEAALRFGGSAVEWYDIFFGVVGREAPRIEEAFIRRLNEINLD